MHTMSWSEKFEKITGYVDTVVRFALVANLSLLFAVLFLQVLFRYIIPTPLIWVEELAVYLAAYLVMWGASSCVRSGSHIRINILLKKLPLTVRYVLTVIYQLLIIYFLYYMCVHGYRFAAMGMQERTPTGTFVFFWPRLAIFTGGLLIIVQIAYIIVKETRLWIEKRKEAQEVNGTISRSEG